MGVANSPDIFQQKMNSLFHGFEFIHAYIDGLLIPTKEYWSNSIQKLKLTLNKLKGKILKCNIEKSFFGKTEMEYLSFWLTHDGVKPINRNIESITNMEPSTSRKEVRKFIGVINYYRDVRPRRSHKLAPLTKLTSIKINSKWTEVEQDAFDEINQIVACDTLSTYLDFNETFKIHTNASVFQSGAVISQKGKTIALYSSKRTDD